MLRRITGVKRTWIRDRRRVLAVVLGGSDPWHNFILGRVEEDTNNFFRNVWPYATKVSSNNDENQFIASFFSFSVVCASLLLKHEPINDPPEKISMITQQYTAEETFLHFLQLSCSFITRLLLTFPFIRRKQWILPLPTILINAKEQNLYSCF